MFHNLFTELQKASKSKQTKQNSSNSIQKQNHFKSFHQSEKLTKATVFVFPSQEQRPKKQIQSFTKISVLYKTDLRTCKNVSFWKNLHEKHKNQRLHIANKNPNFIASFLQKKKEIFFPEQWDYKKIKKKLKETHKDSSIQSFTHSPRNRRTQSGPLWKRNG